MFICGYGIERAILDTYLFYGALEHEHKNSSHMENIDKQLQQKIFEDEIYQFQRVFQPATIMKQVKLTMNLSIKENLYGLQLSNLHLLKVLFMVLIRQ